jgi:hypothetical protein
MKPRTIITFSTTAALALAGATGSVLAFRWAGNEHLDGFWVNWQLLGIELFFPAAFALIAALAAASRRAEAAALVAAAASLALAIYIARDVGSPLYYDNSDSLVWSIYAGSGTNAFATGMLLPLAAIASQPILRAMRLPSSANTGS